MSAADHPETSSSKDTIIEKNLDKNCNQQNLELEKLARQKLVAEAKRAAGRAEMVGAQGFLRPRLSATNKRFLKRTLLSSLASRKPAKKNGEKSEMKFADKKENV